MVEGGIQVANKYIEQRLKTYSGKSRNVFLSQYVILLFSKRLKRIFQLISCIRALLTFYSDSNHHRLMELKKIPK